MASKRKCITVEDKARVIRRLEAGATNREVSREFNLNHSTVSTIWKNRNKIVAVLENNNFKAKKIRPSKHEEIDQALLAWFKLHQFDSDIQINGPFLLEKAKYFAQFIGADFYPDKSWIQRFRQRHGIVLGKVRGVSASAPAADKEEWLTKVLPQIGEGYSDEHISNGEELGLFFKTVPDETLMFKETDQEKLMGTQIEMLNHQTREVIAYVIKFMKEEANHGLQIPLSCSKQRVMTATGISSNTYKKIALEFSNLIGIPNPSVDPLSDKSEIKIELDDEIGSPEVEEVFIKKEADDLLPFKDENCDQDGISD